MYLDERSERGYASTVRRSAPKWPAVSQQALGDGTELLPRQRYGSARWLVCIRLLRKRLFHFLPPFFRRCPAAADEEHLRPPRNRGKDVTSQLSQTSFWRLHRTREGRVGQGKDDRAKSEIAKQSFASRFSGEQLSEAKINY